MKDITIRDTEAILWNVLTSFGYDEEDTFCDRDRYFLLNNKEAAIIESKNSLSRAQAVAVCAESAFACGIEHFGVKISDKEVYEILILFGFENILELDRDIKNNFVISGGDTVFAYGNFEENKTVARIDVEKISSLRNSVEGISQIPSKSLVYAEGNALGVAYEVCYTLRVNGCIVEMYCEDGDIKKASEYADKSGHSALIRCFKDGGIEIKDFSKNEIIKTTLSEFSGYYDEDDCDCGHEHEHGHSCDCGHHHN